MARPEPRLSGLSEDEVIDCPRQEYTRCQIVQDNGRERHLDAIKDVSRRINVWPESNNDLPYN